MDGDNNNNNNNIARKDAKQEAGRLGSLRGTPDLSLQRAPVGSQLKFLPNIDAAARRRGSSAIDSKLGGALPDVLKEAKREERQGGGRGRGDRGQFHSVKREPNYRVQRNIVPVAGGLAPQTANVQYTPVAGSQLSKQDKEKKEEEKRKKQQQQRDMWPPSVTNPPTVLPLRPPAAGKEYDMEDELGVATDLSIQDYLKRTNELTIEEAHKQLFKLTSENENLMPEDELFFLQLPSSLPTTASTVATNVKTDQAGQGAAAGATAAPTSAGAAASSSSSSAAASSSTTVTSAIDAKAAAKQLSGPPRTALEEEHEDMWTKHFQNSLTGMPAGWIGEMIVYKSGKVKLQLGDVVFDVSPGTEFNFLQEVMSIDANTKTCYNLGPIKKRILCMPDVESILEQQLHQD